MIEFHPTPTELLFLEALALITAACVFAPLFRLLKLGAVLGYLAAGLALQLLFAESFAAHPEGLLHVAEFGVVLFLFVIGLELRPSALWRMRADIFGLGFAQMLLCGAAIGGLALLFRSPTDQAIIIGLGLALSSTALVMQTLDEQGARNSPHGRKIFAVLLFQDLAIVPLLFLVTFLAPAVEGAEAGDPLRQFGWAAAAVLGLILVGRFALDPLFRILAKAKAPEIMTAGALGVVIGAAMLMDVVGMSYAMGAFIAGVMLSESSFRHEIEADIEPFRGLFLGLFFMAVGMSVDLQVVRENWRLILLATPAAIIVKALALYLVARVFRTGHPDAVRIALGLPQHGEFGFVLFTAAATAGLLGGEGAAILIAMVSISMALSPLVSALEPILLARSPAETMEEDYGDAQGRILIIGFGRFGQILAQPVFADGVETTILEHDAARVREAQRFGFRVHFGDGARRDVLRAAGAGDADLIAICVDDPETTDRIVQLIKAEFPATKIFARSFDRRHSIRLVQAEVDFAVRETFESALRMGKHVLIALGADESTAHETIADIRQRDRERLQHQVEGDQGAALERIHTRPVRPEPLPKRK